MPITLQQAKALQYGDILYSNYFTNADGKTPVRWRVNGKVKTWKRDSNRVEIPLKYGLYQHGYLINGERSSRVYKNLYSNIFELNHLELNEEDAIEVLKEKGDN